MSNSGRERRKEKKGKGSTADQHCVTFSALREMEGEKNRKGPPFLPLSFLIIVAKIGRGGRGRGRGGQEWLWGMRHFLPSFLSESPINPSSPEKVFYGQVFLLFRPLLIGRISEQRGWVRLRPILREILTHFP